MTHRCEQGSSLAEEAGEGVAPPLIQNGRGMNPFMSDLRNRRKPLHPLSFDKGLSWPSFGHQK